MRREKPASRGSRKPGVLAALTLLALWAPAACVIGSGRNVISVGRPDERPAPVRSLVTAGGVRAPVDPERLEQIYAVVRAQLETITCTRTVTTRDDTRSRVPRPPLSGPITTATRWTEWFDGHQTQTTHRRYCLYANSALGISALPSAGRGAQDSTIHVVTEFKNQPTYPWETLRVQGDTARIGNAGRELLAHSVYAYLHLMQHQGRLGRWLPDAAEADDFDRELAILGATADAWLLLRGGFSGDPQPLLDELLFAREAGMLEAFLVTRRPDAFPERRQAWLAANPDGPDRYRAWYNRTFDVRPGERAPVPER